MIKIKTILSIVLVMLMAGCASTEYRRLPETPPTIPVLKKIEKKDGIYHKVKKGQTLWQISKIYGLSVEEITSANNIPNVASIEVNQLLLIPGAKEVKEAPPVVHTQSTPDDNKDEFAWPIKGKVISYFNDRHGEGVNRGIDIETAAGKTIKASREGRVVLADHMGAYNQTVMIDHADGFISVYANNSKLLVKTGDQVFKGDPVAEAGAFGKKSYLHFEIRKGKEATNPLFYLS